MMIGCLRWTNPLRTNWFGKIPFLHQPNIIRLHTPRPTDLLFSKREREIDIDGDFLCEIFMNPFRNASSFHHSSLSHSNSNYMHQQREQEKGLNTKTLNSSSSSINLHESINILTLWWISSHSWHAYLINNFMHPVYQQQQQPFLNQTFIISLRNLHLLLCSIA
jgi:hypothetical protein